MRVMCNLAGRLKQVSRRDLMKNDHFVFLCSKASGVFS